MNTTNIIPVVPQQKAPWCARTFFRPLLPWTLATGIFISSCTPAFAFVSQSDAIKILVGEASNQGFTGMVCVAEVLRKKGSTKGFYGLKAKHSHTEPEWVWKQAELAWKASEKTNYTHGADHFENIKAFGCPSWIKKCVEVFRYKDHVFYKEVS